MRWSMSMERCRVFLSAELDDRPSMFLQMMMNPCGDGGQIESLSSATLSHGVYFRIDPSNVRWVTR